MNNKTNKFRTVNTISIEIELFFLLIIPQYNICKYNLFTLLYI